MSSDWDKKLELQWSDKRLPPHELFRHNVMPYFCQPDANPFYERTSNNQRVLQQQLGRADNMEEELKNMEGTEYAVIKSQDPVLHIVQKQKRRSPTAVMPLEQYYMVQGDVYMCPDVLSVAHSHISTTLHHLRQAMETARTLKTYHPSEGYTWQRETAQKDESSTLKKFKGRSKRKGPNHDRTVHKRIHRLLQKIDLKFAIPSPNLRTSPTQK